MTRLDRTFDVASLGVFAGAATVTASVYDRLPLRMAVHFSASGNANGWMDRAYGAWVVLGSGLLTWGLLCSAGLWGPGRWGERARQSPMAIVGFVVALFMAGLQVVLLQAGLHPEASIARTTMILLGLFFIAQAALLPRVRRNVLVGVRTPWTLACDENWSRTHRFASYTFGAAGLTSLLCGLAGGPMTVAIAAVLVGCVAPLPYSYVVEWQLSRGR